jgi:hypothetical protein
MNISLGFRSSLMLFAAAWLFATSGAASAQQAQAAGQFLSVAGDVRIVARDGTQRQAARAAAFYEGESIVTGPGALGQLRMADGTLMSVRPDTEMKLDRFAFAGEKDPNPSFLLSVVKGGFRTITGLIGKIKRESYRVATPAATLGIRGTDFELVHVQQQLATPTAPAGTYNRVYDGVTSFQNIAGATLLVSRNQTAFVALQGTAPPVLVAPPADIFGRPTPPPSGPRSLRQDDGKTETAAKIQTAPLLTPLDTAPTLQAAPLLTPIDTAPKTATTIQTAPTTSTSLTAPTPTTIQTAPATTQILTAPTTTLTAPPTTTLIAPTTAPVQTTPILAPVTTTVTTVVKPVTTIVAPVLAPVLK